MMSTFSEGTMWNKLYSMDVIRKHKLCLEQKRLLGEDLYFNAQYFLFVNKVGVIKDCDYIYYIYDGDTLCHRYDPLHMQNSRELIASREKLRRKLGWSEERIEYGRKVELTYEAFRMCSLLFSNHSTLSFRGAVSKIKEDLLNQPELVEAILQGSYNRDRMIRLFQKLLRKGNACLIALTFKILWIGKSRFGYFYTKIKPFFRGD